MGKLKDKLRGAWRRIKAWVYGLLVAVGLVSVPIALAGTISFTWENATTRVDGSAFDPATEQAEIRVYCNPAAIDGSPSFVSSGVGEALSEITTPGDYECCATTVDTDGQESACSTPVTKTVAPALPRPPILED